MRSSWLFCVLQKPAIFCREMSALDCPVCLERFDLQERLPKVLPCSGAHDVCKSCLVLLWPEDGDEFVKVDLAVAISVGCSDECLRLLQLHAPLRLRALRPRGGHHWQPWRCAPM